MAFNIDYFGKVSTSANREALQVFSYNASSSGSNEALATVIAAGYFNNLMQDLTNGVGPLQVGDRIFVTANDDRGIYYVSSVTTNVALSAAGVTADSIGTAAIQDDAVTTAKIADLNVTTGKLAADAVDNTKLADDAVSLENLDSGITPSHIVVYAGQPTTVGGAAAEAFTVTGVAATDLAFVQVVDDGTANVTVLQAVCTLNTLTVTFSANPGADTIINYQILRAAS